MEVDKGNGKHICMLNDNNKTEIFKNHLCSSLYI